MGVDFVSERMERDGYLATKIFGKLSCLGGFVNCNCGRLSVVSIDRSGAEKAGQLTTATDITTMPAGTRAGLLGISFLNTTNKR